MKTYFYVLNGKLTYEEKEKLEQAFRIFNEIISTLNIDDKDIFYEMSQRMLSSIKLKGVDVKNGGLLS